MKIAIVLPGGVDRSGVDRVVPVYLWLIKRLARRHDVHVFAMRHEPGPAVWELLGARVHNVGTERGRARRFFSQFAAEHRAGAFDVVHAILGWEAAYASVVALRHRVPLLFQASGGEFVSMPEYDYGMRRSLAGRVALRLALACAARVTVESMYMQRLAESLGVHPELVPLGVPLDEWPPVELRARDPARPIQLLHVGDIRPVKDQVTLLAAMNLLREGGLNVELDIAGANTMGGVIQRSNAAIQLGSAVRWHGVLGRAALRALMDRADLLVITSRHEADPIVLLEAAIAGVPTVGTAVGHIAEWAPDSAVAVPVGDAAALAREIAGLAADDSRRVAIARSAQRRAVAMDADFTANEFERMYSEMVVDFVPTGDPFTGEARCPYSIELPVLGVPVCFSCNSRYVRSLVEETFGGSSRTADDRTTPHPTLRVRIVVRAGTEGAGAHANVVHSCPDETRVFVQSPGSQAISDPLRHESIAYVTTTLVADRALFRRDVLEAITYSLVSPFDRHPVHAAAIVRDGLAVLLAGPSGTGKSTLAYLAHRDGISVLSDDVVWVQMEPSLRIWGRPSSARLTADTLARFPELRNVSGSMPHADGEKSAVRLTMPGDPARFVAERAIVCILERGERASLERVSATTLAAALVSQLAPGFDRFPNRVDRVFSALTTGGGWRLTLSHDPREALPFLRQALGT